MTFYIAAILQIFVGISRFYEGTSDYSLTNMYRTSCNGIFSAYRLDSCTYRVNRVVAQILAKYAVISRLIKLEGQTHYDMD